MIPLSYSKSSELPAPHCTGSLAHSLVPAAMPGGGEAGVRVPSYRRGLRGCKRASVELGLGQAQSAEHGATTRLHALLFLWTTSLTTVILMASGRDTERPLLASPVLPAAGTCRSPLPSCVWDLEARGCSSYGELISKGQPVFSWRPENASREEGLGLRPQVPRPVFLTLLA